MNVIRHFIENEYADWVHIRRHLHAHPELSHQEVETARYISRVLTDWGIAHQTGIAGNGILGHITPQHASPKKSILLRADMDALPITEKNNVSYQSKHQGVMHACGHDVHMTILLATLRFLHEYRELLPQPVSFIFQPAEEKAPSGARQMIEAGVLQDVQGIFGLHVSPELPCGVIGLCSGPFMASADEIHCKIAGEFGHAAQVNPSKNPVYAAAEWLQFAEKLNHPERKLLVSFGKVEGRGSTNIVPEEVLLSGTLRSFDESLRLETLEKLAMGAQKIGNGRGINIELHIPEGYPVLVNNTEYVHQFENALSQHAPQLIVQQVPPRFGAEDFAWYTRIVPGCFFRLGSGYRSAGGGTALHQAEFDVDEQCLKTGVEAMIIAGGFSPSLHK